MTKRKKLLIGLIVILVVAALAIVKGIYLNKPNKTPREITQTIVDSMQKKELSDSDREQLRTYFKPEVFDKFGKSETKSSDSTSSSDSSLSNTVINIKSVDENGNSATATVEMQASIITLPIQYKFVKEGNYWKGYQWKVSDIIGIPSGDNAGTSKTTKTVATGEKVDIGGGFSLIVGAPADYKPSSSWDAPDDGMRLMAVELQYFNDSSEPADISPTNLTLRDSEGHSFETAFMSEKEPKLETGTIVTNGGTAKGFVTYQVPVGAKITQGVYSNQSSTITINF